MLAMVTRLVMLMLMLMVMVLRGCWFVSGKKEEGS
jgi:hypothetical protein